MKKITLFLLLLFSFWEIEAQVGSYGFTEGVSAYSVLGGTNSTATGDDGTENTINIGFTFNYGGTNYTTFSITTNGWIRLGGAIPGTAWTNSAANFTSATYRPLIAPIWDDNHRNTGAITYQVSGSSPNQVLTVDYNNVNIGGGGSTSATNLASYQIKLYETTNIIEFHYGSMATAGTLSATIGISDASGFQSVTPGTPSTSSNATGNHAISAVTNVANKMYRFTPPSCVAPSGFNATALGTSSATINWSAAVPAPATGYEYYYSNVNTAPSAAGTPINALSANLTGLTTNTLYYVWLRSDCGGGSFSSWAGPFTFRTLCNALPVPFSEGFNSASTTESCWTVLNVNADTDAWDLNYTTTPIEGNQSAMLYTDLNAGANNDWLISPRLTLTGNQRLLFKYKVQSATEPNDFKVMLSIGGNAPADFAFELAPLASYSNTTAQTMVIPMSGISGDVFIAWHVPAAGLDGWRIYIDDVIVEDIPATPPACVSITSPVNGAINVSSGTVTWASNVDATGYNIRVGTTPGGNDVLNNVDLGNVLTHTFATLPGTTYYVTIFPYNDNGSATGCTEINFTTCDAYPVPFLETFNSTSTSEACWTVLNVNGDADAWNMSYATTPITGDQSANIYTDFNAGANNDWLISPKITLTGNQRLIFKYKVQSSGEPNDFRVVLSTTGVAPADFTTILVPLTSYSNTTAQSMVVPLTGITGDVNIAWHIPAGGLDGWRLYIDDVVVEDIPSTPPTCTAITSPTTGAVNVLNGRVTWTANVDATGYNINVGTTPGGTDVLNQFNVGNVTTYTITTLPGTTYYVSVYPYNANGTATGCTEINFTTCDSLTPDVLETFATFLPSCWQSADNGDLIAGPATFGTSSWVADGFGNVGTTGSIRYEIWLAAANDWVISPVINIPATGYELKFDAAATQWNSTAAPTNAWEADDFVQVLVSTTGFNNWTVLYTYNNTNVPSPTGTSNVIDLDSYAGQEVRFAYRVVEGTADGSTDLNFYVDNFEVRLTPASVPPCATNVVGTPNATCGNFANTITWNATVGADGYYISIGTTPGGTNIANNVNLGNVLTYSFTGNVATTYYYTVSPYNGVGPATGCTEMSFTTNSNSCFCIPTYTNGGTGDNITNVVIGSWSNASTGNVTPYYEDFTTQQPTPIAIPTLTAGLASTVSVTMGTDGTQYSRVWIDFNQNSTFETSESFSLGTSVGGSGTANIVVNVPSGATLGVTRMRIRGGDDSAILNTQACGASSSTYGQTEDYLVNIIPTPACLPPTNLTVTGITSSSASLGWTEAGTATLWDVEWGTLGFTATGTPTIVNATNTQFISGLNPNTEYSFYVRANCGAGVYSTWTGPFSFRTSCAPDNVPYSQNFESATVPNLPLCTSQQNVGSGNLWTVANNPGYGFTTNALRYSWNSSNAANVWFYTNGINLVGGTTYKITYDYGSTGTTFPENLKVAYGSSAAAVAMTTTLADHPNVTNSTPVNNIVNFTPSVSGVYYFGFNAYSTADQFYLLVDNIVVDVALSNENFDNSNFMAYPNPVKDVLNVSYTSEISSIRVINMIGQEVISKNINATSTQLDMSHLSAGTYIVTVIVGDSNKTLKVVKQ